MSNGWKGFVNVELLAKDKAAIKKAVMKFEDAFNWLVDMAEQGYKVSIAYQPDYMTWVVSLTGKGAPNDGLTMTQRHADLYVAISALYYAHNNMLDGEWDKVPIQSGFDW